MKINEITYSSSLISISSLPKNQIKNIVSYSKEFDFIDGQHIRQYKDQKYNYFFIQHNEEIVAFFAVENNVINGYYPLVRMENVKKIPGLITLLIIALLKNNMKLIIRNTEDLTPDGFKWIYKLLTNGSRGITLTDQNHKLINLDNIKKEYNLAKNAWEIDKKIIIGQTSILIEHNNSDYTKVLEHTQQHINQTGLVMPYIDFYNDKDIW